MSSSPVQQHSLWHSLRDARHSFPLTANPSLPPSRFPCGARRAALTGSGSDPKKLTYKREWQAETARLLVIS